MPTDEQIASVVALLHRVGLDALYVYGSQATGRARSDSDVDLAVLARHPPDAMEAAALRAEIETSLGCPVDLVFLDQASPILAWQVLRHGRLVHQGSSKRRAEFEIRTITAYADLKRSRAVAERALIERMSNAR